ncbi:MAG: zinc-dependent metalloprotease [Aliidiomarina sp.]|uniref:zinc-dependent metalloprotease n=1 Tax=Aliidiomarina sp. TaxID=1872439 RepID=UPI0025BAFCDF|nr:zinc-dependent metalloprotease [Aliidiomarina sp.]MCH8501317.1 zinc-dependent metalloprotease [Aliidiomarina sp.]
MKKTLIATTLAALLVTPLVYAEEAKENGEKKEEEKSYSDLIKDLDAHEGLFNLYQDPKTGKMQFSIADEQLDKPFLYFATTVDGVVEAGHFRGNYRETKVVEFRRYFDRIDIVVLNNNFHFDEDSALHRAKDANISEATVASLKIKKEADGRILLDADELFLSEALHRVSPWARPGGNQGPSFSLGNLNRNQSRVVNKRAYPNNMDVVVDYVFNNQNPTVRGSNAVTDPRSISIKLQHSFIALPENDFQPRRADARVGYFGQQVTNMTTADWTPFNDVINRWNLVKKDPDAAMSEPVQPIVWWIENTTPVEWRDTVAEGILAWNKAFEAAGFINAIEVRVQPDDAEWDAGDINYNVVRWTSSPRPPFGGYGPSLANPLTGELIAADIMMEYVYMSNRWMEHEIFADDAYGLGHQHDENGLYCSQGHLIHSNLIAGRAMADLLGNESIEDNELLRQGMVHVILHEVGHTLGLNHNMKASILWDENEVHDASLTQGVLTGSVMDYAPVNIAPPGVEQGDFYQYVVGPYDVWAIEYGYSPALDDADAEEARLEAILSRSHEHGLAFGNDADDMRAPGRHIDPQVMIGDMSSNPVAYALGRFEVVNHTLDNLLERTRVDGRSHQRTATTAGRLFGQYSSQAGVISRQIGGVYVERAVVGQGADAKPFTPVPRERQKAAMQALKDHVFAPDVLHRMEPVLAYMQNERRFFNHSGNNEDPKFHSMVLNMQRNVFNHLLHPWVLQRITDSTRYGNEYSLHEVMGDLTDAVFQANKPMTTTSKNLQIEYVNRLLNVAGFEGSGSYDNLSKVAATAQLNRIRAMRAPRRSDFEATAHYDYIKRIIDNAFNS